MVLPTLSRPSDDILVPGSLFLSNTLQSYIMSYHRHVMTVYIQWCAVILRPCLSQMLNLQWRLSPIRMKSVTVGTLWSCRNKRNNLSEIWKALKNKSPVVNVSKQRLSWQPMLVLTLGKKTANNIFCDMIISVMTIRCNDLKWGVINMS